MGDYSSAPMLIRKTGKPWARVALLQVKKITINNRKNDEGAVDGWMRGYFY